MQFPELTSQMRAVLSRDPVRARLPSGLKATDAIESVWPSEKIFCANLARVAPAASVGLACADRQASRSFRYSCSRSALVQLICAKSFKPAGSVHSSRNKGMNRRSVLSESRNRKVPASSAAHSEPNAFADMHSTSTRECSKPSSTFFARRAFAVRGLISHSASQTRKPFARKRSAIGRTNSLSFSLWLRNTSYARASAIPHRGRRATNVKNSGPAAICVILPARNRRIAQHFRVHPHLSRRVGDGQSGGVSQLVGDLNRPRRGFPLAGLGVIVLLT